MKKEKKDIADRVKQLQESSLLKGEGISDVEEKRQKLEEKRAFKADLTDEERTLIAENIMKGIAIKPDINDILAFVLAQLIPILILGSAFYIPGVIYLSTTTADMRNFMIILIILGSCIYLYAIIRFICAMSYKMEINADFIKWRNVFKWSTIPREEVDGVFPMQSYYFYLTKIGGIIRFGIEIFNITSEAKDFWVRAYPLRKTQADNLFKIISFWVEKE